MDGTFRERSQRKYHLMWMGHVGKDHKENTI